MSFYLTLRFFWTFHKNFERKTPRTAFPISIEIWKCMVLFPFGLILGACFVAAKLNMNWQTRPTLLNTICVAIIWLSEWKYIQYSTDEFNLIRFHSVCSYSLVAVTITMTKCINWPIQWSIYHSKYQFFCVCVNIVSIVLAFARILEYQALDCHFNK